MENTFTAIIKQDGVRWVRWIEEIHGVNCQELLDTLKMTLKEALGFNRQDAIRAAESNFHEVQISV